MVFRYVSLGVLFILIVLRRRWYFRRDNRMAQPSRPDDAIGLPPHFGIFVAVGIAFVAEGLFSACYHTCPKAQVFQFDTCMSMCCIVQTRSALQGLHVASVYHLWPPGSKLVPEAAQ